MAKRYNNSVKLVDDKKLYSVSEAFTTLNGFQAAKFDETVEISVRLGVDAKKSDQMVRGSVSLPNGLGRKVRILVFAKGDKVKEAEKAGADFVGAEELIQKIEGGWVEFDKVVATPDLMAMVSKVAKVLGPRGLMPNPKLGTVSPDVAKVIGELKAGKVDFRIDKAGIVHAPIGKKSFGPEKLQENYKTVMDAIVRAKPSTSKGIYLRSITLSSTMSPGVHINVSEAAA